MRCFSTLRSADAREVSILAILETLVAISLSVGIAMKLGTVKWIVLSAALAPLLLLRTQRSKELGLKLFDILCGWVTRHASPGWGFEYFSILWMVAAVTAPVARLLATILTVLRHPILSLRSIPSNWFRTTFCVDVCCPLEVVPGYEAAGIDDSLKLSMVMPQLSFEMGGFKSEPPVRRIAIIILLLAFGGILIVGHLALIFIPCLIYRWSLKATCLIYSPLLWVVSTTFRKIDDVTLALRRLRESDLYRVTVCYSVCVVLAFSLKIFLMIQWDTFAEWWNATKLSQFLSIYVVPAAVPVWQIAACVNGVLAIALFIFVGAALRRIGHTDSWPEGTIETILRSTTFVRWLLTVYTITCTAYITAQSVKGWTLPKIGPFFPWTVQ